MIENIYGHKEFPAQIDITDPCYNKNVWCRINNFPISAGKYECYTIMANNNETKGWGNRVARIGIRKENATTYKRIGSIGVDAGLAGFFDNKPDYNDEEWMTFCNRSGNDAWIIDEGFYSSSGYGDGCYEVYAGYKNGEVVEMYIDFLSIKIKKRTMKNDWT